MAERKFGLGTVLLIGAAAAAAAGGVVSYIKRAEIKRLAEEIIARVKPTDAGGVYTADLDGDGRPDVILADLDGDGRIDAVAVETGEPNIIDSGISLESVENPAGQSEGEAQPDAGAGTEADNTDSGAADMPGGQDEDTSTDKNESRSE